MQAAGVEDRGRTGRTAAQTIYQALIDAFRLAGAVLVEAHHEWQVTGERRYLSEHSMAQPADKTTEEVASLNS